MSIPWGEPAQLGQHQGTGFEELERIDLEHARRRELFSSRAVPSMIAASWVILFGLYIVLECGLRIVGQPAWLVDPQEALERMASWPQGVPPVMLGGVGALLTLAGLVFLLCAVLPGRRARHSLDDPRIAVVVDNEVISSALALVARRAAGLMPDQVRVTTSRRTVSVLLQQGTNVSVDAERVREAVRAELAAMGLSPLPKVRVQAGQNGVVEG